MLFDFGIANLSLVGYLFKKWQNMSLVISILPFSHAILSVRLFHDHVRLRKLPGQRMGSKCLKIAEKFVFILFLFTKINPISLFSWKI